MGRKCADRFKDTQYANRVYIRGVTGLLPRRTDKTLCRQIIQFVGLNIAYQAVDVIDFLQIKIDHLNIAVDAQPFKPRHHRM